jgi:hypothetical protein
MADSDDYGIVLVKKDSWEVYKFDAHHGKHVQTYSVKLSYGSFHCDCPAAKSDCRHIMMVNAFRLGTFNQKKDLF